MREMAGPEKMPWVRIAYTFVAPAEMSLNGEERLKMFFKCPQQPEQGLLVSGVTDSSTRVSHVIDENGNPIFHISYKNHAVHLVCLFSLLVNESKVYIQPVCYRGYPENQKVTS